MERVAPERSDFRQARVRVPASAGAGMVQHKSAAAAAALKSDFIDASLPDGARYLPLIW